MIQVMTQEKKRSILIALETDEEIGNLEEEGLAIIEDISEALERKQRQGTSSQGYTKEEVFRENC